MTLSTLIGAAVVSALLSVAPGKPAPAIDAPDLAGKTVALKALQGKVVLVDFWATWCEPCRDSLPHYQALHERYGDKGLVLVAVSVDEDRERVDSFIRKQKLTFRVVHDVGSAIVPRWDPPKMPTAYLIDAKGVVRHVYEGFSKGTEATIERDLQALLAERS